MDLVMAITLALVGVGMALGAGFIPALAIVGGTSLPPMVSQPLAKLCLIVGMNIHGRAELTETATGEYELRAGDDEHGPARAWSRFGLVPFGITYDRVREAFGTVAVDDAMDGLEANATLPGKKATASLERGGADWFVDLRMDAEAIIVRAGQALGELRDTAGVEIANLAEAAGLEESGGDTSGYSPAWLLGGGVLMLLLGVIIGYTVFF